ncbi:MAG TPA: hypothetical protein VG496_11020 [Myxococcales bacterium]|nr:hypothetical protein [Myxococcales bacterium]
MGSATVLFEGSARTLLIAHAVFGFAAVFAATHHATSSILAASGRPARAQLQRFGSIAPVAVVAQAAFGLAVYPAYRVRVRLAHLELTAPAVAELFEVKEHFAALAIALVVAASLAGRALPPRPPLAEARSVAALSACGAALLWAAALIGLYVTVRHPVGFS